MKRQLEASPQTSKPTSPRTTRKAWILVYMAALLGAQNAYGYLDPGSGSVVMQAIVAALIGASLAIKMFWQRLKAFVIRLFSRSPASDE